MNRPQPFPDAGLIKSVRSVIEERVTDIDSDERDLTLKYFDELVDRWQRILPPYMVVLGHLVPTYRLCILLDLSHWRTGSGDRGLHHPPCEMWMPVVKRKLSDSIPNQMR